MPVDVSVVVPFFNPGPDLDECVASMLDQTLAAERFEVLLVDDGSTDGSGLRADEWADRHRDLIRVIHLPASGSPARPRNVGAADARGRYLQFVDSDDALAPAALGHLVAVADSSAADVVVHKISAGGPRNIYHQLFRRNATGLTLATAPELIRNGTVCKMFRREFLQQHRIAFPEGQTYAEDQHLCLRAYANARSIALVSDVVTYFHRRSRAGGTHFGDSLVEPAAYRRELEALLDVLDAEVESPVARFAAAWRYYRGEVLGRLRGEVMLTYDDDYRAELVREMSRLAATRFPAEIHAHMPAMIRVQSSLLLDGDVAGLVRFSRELERLRLQATTTGVQWRDGRLVVAVAARFTYAGVDFRFDVDGDRLLVPESFAAGPPHADRAWGPDDLADLDLDLALIARRDAALWSNTAGLRLDVDGEGRPLITGDVAIDPMTVMGGVPLSAGRWDFQLRVAFSGLSRSTRLMPPGDNQLELTRWAAPGRDVTPFWTRRAGALAVEVSG
jgi:glycosyltransferase involved in cell wall biosynthesis